MPIDISPPSSLSPPCQFRDATRGSDIPFLTTRTLSESSPPRRPFPTAGKGGKKAEEKVYRGFPLRMFPTKINIMPCRGLISRPQQRAHAYIVLHRARISPRERPLERQSVEASRDTLESSSSIGGTLLPPGTRVYIALEM